LPPFRLLRKTREASSVALHRRWAWCDIRNIRAIQGASGEGALRGSPVRLHPVRRGTGRTHGVLRRTIPVPACIKMRRLHACQMTRAFKPDSVLEAA
jgi:hypothetical protein